MEIPIKEAHSHVSRGVPVLCSSLLRAVVSTGGKAEYIGSELGVCQILFKSREIICFKIFAFSGVFERGQTVIVMVMSLEGYA
jgi:hypothetical protein